MTRDARQIGALADAAAAGFRCGLQRRAPSDADNQLQGSRRLRSAFARGRRRGLARAAVLEQQELWAEAAEAAR